LRRNASAPSFFSQSPEKHYMSDSEIPFGAIFDWDGVIIDSAESHKKSWHHLADEVDRELPEDFFEKSFGQRNVNIIPNFLGWTDDEQEVERLSRRKEELYRELIKANGIEALAGVKLLLEDLHASGVPCVIGSSTERKNIEVVLELLGFEEYFQGIVAGDEVSRGKPDPEVFLRCAEMTGQEPPRCVVFEDSRHGIEAAIAGKMKTVAVATTHPLSEFEDADLAVISLAEISAERLRRLWESA
jgi:beta-phosphoglucomutase family hydrolase